MDQAASPESRETGSVEPLAALADLPLKPEGVLALRARIFGPDDAITIAEGETLFALARHVGDRGCREWRDFFCEAIADLMVHQLEPRGYLSDANADWMIARLAGRPVLATEFAALLHVMERARIVPDRLAAFALGLVEQVVLTGEGEAITGERHEPGRVTFADVQALRRVLYVASSEGFGHVTRAEAEVLMRIAEATAGADNDPSFADLYARAIGNHLLAGPGRHAPARLQVLDRNAWLDQRRSIGSGVVSTFRQMAAQAFGVTTRPVSAEGASAAIDAASGLSPDRVDDEEAAWLLGRLEGRGELGDPERALLAFVATEALEISPRLRALMTRVA